MTMTSTENEPETLQEGEEEINDGSNLQIMDRITFTYIPAVGAISHTAFAVHILNRPILPRYVEL